MVEYSKYVSGVGFDFTNFMEHLNEIVENFSLRLIPTHELCFPAENILCENKLVHEKIRKAYPTKCDKMTEQELSDFIYELRTGYKRDLFCVNHK